MRSLPYGAVRAGKLPETGHLRRVFVFQTLSDRIKALKLGSALSVERLGLKGVIHFDTSNDRLKIDFDALLFSSILHSASSPFAIAGFSGT